MRLALRTAWLVVFIITCASLTTAAAAADGALKPGDVLGQDNWQTAKDLLPPEILRHYEKGEYRNAVVAYPQGTGHWEQAFLEATEKNATTLDVDDKGSIIEKSTGKQPDYYYGIPFPHIDPDDPKAGVKIVWNQFLAYWNGGSSYNQTAVIMASPEKVERNIIAEGWFQFYDGQAPKYRLDNPLNLQSSFLGVARRPADLEGTASLNWRYRDPGKRDSQWAFVPMLRRVRQVSPSNRSDGYLGSDISADDGFFFDGKPEDFEWKLVGKRQGLRIVDPNTVKGPIDIKPAPGGGWIALTDLNPPTYGANTPDWKGISWAPTDPALAERSFYIVEGRPRDKYYLYGRLELWIDAETWDGAWNRKFSWDGELVNVYQLNARVNHKAGSDGDIEWLPVSTMTWACAENFKMNRASLSGMRANPNDAAYRRVKHKHNLFDPMTLQRFGK